MLASAFYQRTTAVAFYSPARNEVATENLRDHALQAGKKVFYPRSNADGSPSLIQIESAGELIPGRFGILEPCGDEFLSERDELNLLVLVPGAAFDVSGNRLGRGQGWYDRLLGSMKHRWTTVGLAYELQIVEKVPVESWDRRVDYIATEKRWIDCSAEVPDAETAYC